MDLPKTLEALVMKATSESTEQISPEQLQQILKLLNQRADMPKHVIASISKRMALKNKRVLINVFTLLEFLVYSCQLSLYSQIATKEFLFKISGLLTNKDIDPEVKTKVLETIFCCEELFRPHEDLIPLFFHFYAGVLRNGFDIPTNYRSPFRPAQLKQYKKAPSPNEIKKSSSQSQNQKPQKQAPSITQKKTFEQIREKLILTNQIIDNANPADNVKDQVLLLEMIEQIKDCEKKVNRTINENPNQAIMELALAANDDIFITYRRFKDLQRNRKPEPFILTELASEAERERELKKNQSINSSGKLSSPVKTEKAPEKKSSKQTDFLDFDEPTKKVETKTSVKKQESLFDMDFTEPVKKQAPKQQGQSIFDLLGDAPSNQPPIPVQQPMSMNLDLLSGQPTSQVVTKTSGTGPTLGTFDDLLLTTQFQNVPQPTGNGISLNMQDLNANDFSTEADIKNYSNKSVMDRFDDLTNQYLKK